MMTASSSEFIAALFTQTGGFIDDLFPLLAVGLGLVVALIAFNIIVRSFLGPIKKLFK